MLRYKALGLAGITFALIVLLPAVPAVGQEKVLFRFNGTDGYLPEGPVVLDEAGNLYGTTSDEPEPFGNVFELSRTPDGGWKKTILYSFCRLRLCADGAGPAGGLVLDAAGNLYGTTNGGGEYAYTYGGTVFELSPKPDGTWTETVLHSFGGPGDGSNPLFETLLMDSSGNLYGTTAYGGGGTCKLYHYPPVGCGTVFELGPGTGGNWTEKILYTFQNSPSDGRFPFAGLVPDASGNLYGVTSEGGVHSTYCQYVFTYTNTCGTVFELSPNSDGTWKETILHFFKPSDGSYPTSTLTIDSNGILFGTAPVGGRSECYRYLLPCGTVFELAPTGNGKWVEKVLRAFYFDRYPAGSVVLDGAGNIYGTTLYGGDRRTINCYGCGTLFKLTPGANGQWTQATLHSFGADGDGELPSGGLVFDSSGNLYGTTQHGGLDLCTNGGCGTVFEFRPRTSMPVKQITAH